MRLFTQFSKREQQKLKFKKKVKNTMNTKKLEEKAKDVRKRTFEMVINSNVGHLGGSFSCTEILVTLYYGQILRFDSQNPQWEDRDRFILSKGHANNTLYVILGDLGYYPDTELENFCRSESFLGNHCDKTVPGVEIITGSLGHGLGVASGIALGAKLSGKDYMTFVVLGDAECQEGSIWEAAMFASHHRLDNLIAFLDRNRFGAEDCTENTLALYPTADKWSAFGWEVKPIDGHSFDQIFSALKGYRNRNSSKPMMIIAKTVKGKGISFLENQPKAHHTVPKGEEVDIARRELE